VGQRWGTSGKMVGHQWQKKYGTILKKVRHQWENGKEPMDKWWGTMGKIVGTTGTILGTSGTIVEHNNALKGWLVNTRSISLIHIHPAISP